LKSTTTMSSQRERVTARYEGGNARYRLSNAAKSYTQQYSHVYSARLFMLKGGLMARAKERWPSAQVVERIVSATTGALIAVVGTTFKEQTRPNVLDEYRSEILHSEEAEEGDVGVVRVKTYEAGADDAIAVEDESGRVRLAGDKVNVARLVTGVTVAVLGRIDAARGELVVDDVLGPGFLPPPPSPAPSPGTGGKKILLVADLLGQTTHDAKFALLCDWLNGALGDEQQTEAARSVVRCVVAGDVGGDLSDVTTKSKGLRASSNGHNSGTSSSLPDSAELKLRDADVAIARLCAMLPVDVIPGASDPTNATLPQQPVHPLLFPHASRYSTFVSATNPHEFSLDDHLVCGHAGQPVLDILAHADYSTSGAAERVFDHHDRCVQRAGDGPDDAFLAALDRSVAFLKDTGAGGGSMDGLSLLPALGDDSC